MTAKTLLLFLLFTILNGLQAMAQHFDKDNPAVAELQKSFNATLTSAIKEYKLDWPAALKVSDEVINNILSQNFRVAEKYFRSKDTKSTMIKIDSCIQFGMIKTAFTTRPELDTVKVNDYDALIRTIQQSRRNTKASKIGLEAIKTGSALYFGSIILNYDIDELIIFFNDLQYFSSQKKQLQNLAETVKSRNLTFFPFPSTEGENIVMTCSFLEGNKKAVAQVKLVYNKNDYYGKIVAVTFVPVNRINFNNENRGTIAIE